MLEIFEWLIAYSARASLLCVATLLILVPLKQVSASMRSGIVFAGTVGAILLPMTVGILPPISLAGFFSGEVTQSIPLENVMTLSGGREGLIGHQVAPDILDHAGMAGVSIQQNAETPWWVTFLVVGWLCGVVASLALTGVRFLSVLRLRAQSRRLSPGHLLVMEANTAAASLGYRRALDVRVSERVEVPSAIGLGFGALLLPIGFEELDPVSRRAVLTHECAHLRRRDSLVQFLIVLCRCIHWFNPLFLALDRAFNAEAEKACDDQVIGCGISPELYSETILGYFQLAATGSSGAAWSRAASGFYPCPQLDRQLRGRKKMILTRIRRMVDPAARRTRLGALLGWLFAGVATVSASVLGALVLVPDYEWRYQLAKRELPFADQLVACWRMDEIRAQTTPDSGSHLFFGSVGGGTLDHHGHLDHAIYLDGDDYVDMGDHFRSLQYPITLTAWVRADEAGEGVRGSQNIVWLGGGLPDQYIYIGLNKGRAAIKSRDGEVAVVTGRKRVTDGQWHHLTGVFASESHRLLYVDGELAAEDTRFAMKPPTFHLQVGRNGRKSRETSYIQGAVDDVRVYSAALNKEAVAEIMKGDFALVAARRVSGAE
ncbi:M56 family metallopeptidase [Verrucomicrobiaceae bacterium 227]